VNVVEGELERRGEAWTLRFTRRLRHPAEKVWRALTEREHLQQWFPQRVVGEWRPGAALRFEDADPGVPTCAGEVIACEAPSLLEFTWGTDRLRFEISPHGTECVLTLIDTIDTVEKAARDGAGWHACLDVLEHVLDGRPAPWDPGQRWSAVHPRYVQKFGPEAAVIGPPPGRGPGTGA
jgi:uncharacterized protein YndB with AHSA1/START domain